jgi:hypothetical protein
MPWRLLAVAVGICLWSVRAQAQHDVGRVEAVPMWGPLQVKREPNFFAWRIDTATGDLQVCGYGPKTAPSAVCTAPVPSEGGVAPPLPNPPNLTAAPEETSSLPAKRAFGKAPGAETASKDYVAYEVDRYSPALPAASVTSGQSGSTHEYAWNPVGLPVFGLELADLISASLSGSGVISDSAFTSATSGIPISESVPTPLIWGSASGLAFQLARLSGLAFQLARLNGTSTVTTLIPASSTLIASLPLAQNASPAIAVNSVTVEVSRVTVISTATSPKTTTLALGGAVSLGVPASSAAGVSAVTTGAGVSAVTTAGVSAVTTGAGVSAVTTGTGVSAVTTGTGVSASTTAGLSAALKAGVSAATTAGVSAALRAGVSAASTAGISASTTAGLTATPGVSASTTAGSSAALKAGVSASTTAGSSAATTPGVSASTTAGSSAALKAGVSASTTAGSSAALKAGVSASTTVGVAKGQLATLAKTTSAGQPILTGPRASLGHP